MVELSLFENLTAPEVKNAMSNFRSHQYKQGEYLFNMGDEADSIFILQEGLVKISYISIDGDEKILDIFEPGDILGELFLGKYRHRIGHAQALRDTLAYKLSERQLYRLVQRNAEIALNLIRHLADEQREQMARMHALLRADARCRLLGTLLSLGRQFCCVNSDIFELDPMITQEDLANLSGLNRSTVSSLINKLRREGILGGSGRNLMVHMPEAERLLRESGFELLE